MTGRAAAAAEGGNEGGRGGSEENVVFLREPVGVSPVVGVATPRPFWP